MKSLFLITLLLVLSSCSYTPTLERFEKAIESHTGEKLTDSYGVYKEITDGNKKYFYTSFFNRHINKECRFIRITDLNDTILGHEILTPKRCKRGATTS